MKESGKTDDQIDHYFVPKTMSERKKKEIDDIRDFGQMKKDIATLKEEVKQLRAMVGKGADGNDKPRIDDGGSTTDEKRW